MNSEPSQMSMDRINDVLGSVRKKGVRLWSENGQLRYTAPKGALTHEEIARLRTFRGQIVALLEKATVAHTIEPTLEPRPRLDRAPLSFSQLAHWNFYQLSTRSAIRQIASATRLRGRLDVDALQTSVSEMVRRHEALRTRVVVCHGTPVQEIAETGDRRLKLDDLAQIPESSREAKLNRLIDEIILEPINVAVGPLFGARLVKLSDDDHVLVLAMEHMISDAFSRGILLRDLFTAYTQASNGRVFSLPALPVQFADYAVWQRNAHQSWVEKHSAHWNEYFANCRRTRFPEDKDLQCESRLGWGTVPVKIGRDLKEPLRAWCRLRRTTLAMSIFTAYVGLVLRWCDVSECVIRYHSDGRTRPEIQSTIGYFASVLYVRVELLKDDRFVDLMNRVIEEYCKAYEQVDYSCVASQVPRPEFTRNTGFNWIPQGSRSGAPVVRGSKHTIACSPVRFVHPMLRNLHPMLRDLEGDNEPSILLYDSEDEIVGSLSFPLSRFSIRTMERFGRNFLVFVKELLERPEAYVKSIVLR